MLKNWLAIANVTDDGLRERLVSCSDENSGELRQNLPQCFEGDLRNLREVALDEGKGDPQDLYLFLSLLGIEAVLSQFRGRSKSNGPAISKELNILSTSSNPLGQEFHRCNIEAPGLFDDKIVLHNSSHESSGGENDVHSFLYCRLADLEKD